MAACGSSGFLSPASEGWTGRGSRLGGPQALQWPGPWGSWAVVEPWRGMLLCSCSCPGLGAGPGSFWVWWAPPFLCYGAVSLQDVRPPRWPQPQLHSVPVSALGFSFHFN